MATVTHTWTFDTDAEGLVDNSESAYMDFGHGGDNAVQFHAGIIPSFMGTLFESGIGDFTETFQDWGVPYNSLVTDLQITGFAKKVKIATNVSAHLLDYIDVYRNATTIISYGGHLIESRAWNATTVDSDYVAQSGGPKRTLSTPLISSTTVALKIHHIALLNFGGHSEVGYDSIALEITYEPYDEVADLVIDNATMTITATEPTMFTITDLAIDNAQMDMTSDEMAYTLPIDNAELQFYSEHVTFSHVYALTIANATMSIVSASTDTNLVVDTSTPSELVGTMPISAPRLVRQIVGQTRLIS